MVKHYLVSYYLFTVYICSLSTVPTEILSNARNTKTLMKAMKTQNLLLKIMKDITVRYTTCSKSWEGTLHVQIPWSAPQFPPTIQQNHIRYQSRFLNSVVGQTPLPHKTQKYRTHPSTTHSCWHGWQRPSQNKVQAEKDLCGLFRMAS